MTKINASSPLALLNLIAASRRHQKSTTKNSMADWTLETCCETEEVWYISMFAIYLVVNALLWNHSSEILKPMKLVAVFFHEFSHATMCWLTGGKVEGIEVYNNEGGVTKYRGGKRLCVIPAGCEYHHWCCFVYRIDISHTYIYDRHWRSSLWRTLCGL